MFGTLEFIMVACLFADLVVVRGAAVFSWLKGAVSTVESDVKKL